VEIGVRLGGRFVIERFATEGGMGAVYRALDGETGRPVAIKVLAGDGDQHAARFDREVELLSTIEHPAIVRHVAHGVDPRHGRFLAMEWLDGGDLHELLNRRRLSVGQSVTLVRRVASALAVLHDSGIVHRDVKPENLAIVDGDPAKVKLLDFGIARHSDYATMTKTGAILGSPKYMSPEQVRGRRDLDARADVFSLGCVFHHCLCGTPPFSGDQLASILGKIIFEEVPLAHESRPDVPQDVSAIVARMLAKAPDDRFADGRAVVEALDRIDGTWSDDGGGSASLTRGELRLVSVILFGMARGATGEDVTMTAGESNPALEALERVADAHSASLHELIDGSLIVTLRGAGVATDQAMRAVRCAEALVVRLPRRPCAVTTGPGQVEGRHVVGDVLDRAAELSSRPEGLHHGAIVVDELTASLVSNSVSIIERDGWRLLGGVKPAVPRTRFVGRRRDVALLRSTLEESLEESVARAVLVTGPSGIGKSRLNRHVVHDFVEAESIRLLSAHGDPVNGSSPFRLIAESLPGSDFLRLPDEAGDADVWRDRITDELVGVLETELSHGPIVWVIDDAQWGDVPSFKLMEAAVRRLAQHPLIVVASSRNERQPILANIADVHLRLKPLSPHAASKLVEGWPGGGAAELAGAARNELIARGSGNPLYLEELLRARDRGSDTSPTVLAMVQARLESLALDLRRPLRAASVFGGAFSAAAVAALLEVDEATAAEQLRTLEREHWVFPSASGDRGREYVFSNDLIREAAYGTLTQRDRKVAHALAAKWLVASGSLDPVTLATHQVRSGHPGQAVQSYVDAASAALVGDDLDAALRYVELGERCGAGGALGGQLELIRAEVFRWRSESAAGRSAAERAMEALPRASAAWFRAGGLVVSLSRRLGDLAPEHLAMAQSMAGAPHEPAQALPRARALARAACELVIGGRRAAGAMLLTAAEQAADDLDRMDPTLAAAISEAHAFAAHAAGDASGYLDHMQRVVAQHELGDARRHACVAQINLGYAARELGLFERARDVLVQALATAERLQMPESAAAARHNLGFCLARLGDVEGGLNHERAAVAVFDKAGNALMRGASQTLLARIHLESGALEQAREHALAASQTLAELAEARAYAGAVLAAALLAEGDVAEAVNAAAEAAATLDRLGSIEDGEAFVRLTYAEALAAAGNREEAGRVMAAAQSVLHERAGRIVADRRKQFLERVPENAATLAWPTDAPAV
jgi:eukaryotic-like serine/threonine-protein kinase